MPTVSARSLSPRLCKLDSKDNIAQENGLISEEDDGRERGIPRPGPLQARGEGRVRRPGHGVVGAGRFR
eukprot:scaffold19771_cov60-Phaeocystis_antarctica.AAC.2